MKKVNASLTVEAALILPLVLMLFAVAMNVGIQLYQDCRDTAIAIGQEEEIDVIDIFYNWTILEDVIKDED